MDVGLDGAERGGSVGIEGLVVDAMAKASDSKELATMLGMNWTRNFVSSQSPSLVATVINLWAPQRENVMAFFPILDRVAGWREVMNAEFLSIQACP